MTNNRFALDEAVRELCAAIRRSDVPAIDYWQQLIRDLETRSY